jgi:rhodanese-related sulfurtransferase
MAEHTRFEKLVAEAKKKITEILPQDAGARLKIGEAVIVDVREQDEWDEEHIPGAIHISRGTIELDIEEKVPRPERNDHLSLRRGRAFRACRRDLAKNGLQKRPLDGRRL